MIPISGFFFNGVDSQKFTAQIEVHKNILVLKYADNEISYLLEDVTLSPPLGQSARAFEFQDGARFETFEFAKVDQNFPSGTRTSYASHFIDTLEKNMLIAIGACLFILLFMAAGYRYGIPMAAKYLAHKAPYKALLLSEKGALDTLKHIWKIKLTSIDSEKYSNATKVFEKVSAQYSNLNIRIDTTSLKIMGPNAFALPAGQIVVTERLLDLVTPQELYAILLHEVGHIEHRHGAQAIIKNAGLFIIFSLVLGVADFSSIPLAVIASSYSRDDEREADLYSAQALLKEGLSPLLLSDGLKKIEKVMGLDDNKKTKNLEGILSSHPLTFEREQTLKKLAQSLEKESSKK